MKTIIKSIHPKWCEKIASGEKTIELGKGFSKMEVPFKVYIYETKNQKGRGKVIGEFICNQVDKIIRSSSGYCVKDKSVAYTNVIAARSCLYFDDLQSYFGDKGGEALHISELKIYDKPKELSEFYITKKCVPVNSYFGDKQNWDDRHKRCSASLPRESWGIPIECHRCKNLYVAKEPYLDEKSGCMLFDYDCKTKYHKPIARAPQNYCKCEELEERK